MERSSSASAFRPGDMVKGRYAVFSVCGAGGMGSIYRVRDTAANNREAALKVLNPALISQDESAAERFSREAVIAAGLKHPNIVEVYDFSLDPSGPMIMAMEFVDGVSLAERIANREIGKLSFPQIVKILKDIAAGLAFAHEQGVVHRDLKPANVLLGPSGVAKIADFGLCRSEIFDKGLTQVGECVGTPLYMAPEQISTGHADTRSDVYSFGILAYELVAGHVPFNGETWFEIAERHLNSPIPAFGFSIPKWFDDLLAICLEKEARHRFSSGVELAQWLEDSIGDDPHESHELPRPRLFPKESMSSRASFAVVAICSFLVVSIGLSSGALNSVYYRVRGMFEESYAPLPEAAFMPVSQRILTSSPVAKAATFESGRKVFVCVKDGAHVFTTTPPPNGNCLEAK